MIPNFLKKTERNILPENADLETIMRNEIDYLDLEHARHTEACNYYKNQSNALKELVRAAGIKV